ncbi:MAG TPA: LacI family transcriptional regulator [Clostridiales bacterium]|nr:LacI family transcriptional regulator [Clostridiales bacterium]
MNIYDISKKAGVSIATVSRVLNDSPRVSEKTRDKVLSVMEQNSYTPNVYARGLGLGSMNTIGILCADSSDIYLANAVYYLERDLRQHGYSSILCCTGYELESKQNCMKLLLSKRTDAIILVGSTFIEKRAEHNNYILEAGMEVPVMLINGYLEGSNLYCSLCDEHQAVYDVTSRLLNQGFDNPIHLYRALSYSGLQKKEGFLQAISEKGLNPQDRVHECSGDMDDVIDFLDSLYDSGKRFNAIITSNDELAIGAIKFARAKGLRIPEGISIVGHNNSKLARYCEPELTSIDNKLEMICIHTVTTLMRIFDNKNVANKTMFSAELIKRQTTSFN